QQEDGKSKLFTVSVRSKPAPYIEKLNKGEEVTVTTTGKFNSVVKVSTGAQNNKYSFKRSSGGDFKKSTYDHEKNTRGQISGMVLKLAVDLYLHGEKIEKPRDIVNEIVKNASIVLAARPKIDALVEQSLKSKLNSDEDLEDDVEEIASPKKSRSNAKPVARDIPDVDDLEDGDINVDDELEDDDVEF